MPLCVDTVVLTEDTDYGALAEWALRGGGGSSGSDCFPVDWMFRAYELAAGTPYADQLARGVATVLTSDDPMVRSQALVFFDANPGAAGAERVLDLLTIHRTLFAGVPNPMGPTGPDLESALLSTLGSLVRTGDRFADAACDEVLLPTGARVLAGPVARIRPEWALAHAEAIVRAAAPAGASLLIALQGTDSDLVALARRIVPLCRADERFELDIERFIDDPGLRAHLLATYRAA